MCGSVWHSGNPTPSSVSGEGQVVKAFDNDFALSSMGKNKQDKARDGTISW